MNITFNDGFYDTSYADDNAASTGRMEIIIEALSSDKEMQIVNASNADLKLIAAVHTESHIETVQKSNAYNMALLAAGVTCKAADYAMNGEPAFACVRPPGHHANKNHTWGHCYFNNMAIALTKLRNENRIESAFIIDFDAHTGDGTINCLKEWDSVYILNPMADTREAYLKLIDSYINNLPAVDIVAVCAGFDSYIEDVGRKLLTFDFYAIGKKVRLLAKKLGHNRRFGVLEGGYYIPDLGKNVLAFCQGLND